MLPLPPAPSRVVVQGSQLLGRFGTAFERANLVDAPFANLPRAVRRWRLKEWQALQIMTPELFANVALFDAKLMSLLQAKVFDRSTSKKTLHEWKLPPYSFTIADSLFGTVNEYRNRRGGLRFENDLGGGRIRLRLDLQGARELPGLVADLTVFVDRGALQTVSLPFANEVGMVSHKGMFPVSGTLSVGSRTFTLRANEALALLDDHKGFYPWVMKWDWVTSATYRGEEAVGFNLTTNQCRSPERYNENCVFRGSSVFPLPAVTFTRSAVKTKNERWFVRDREGRVDLSFTPTVPGDVRVNAVLVESRYRGPFGTFSGKLEPEGGEAIVVDDWFGMGEDFYLRC